MSTEWEVITGDCLEVMPTLADSSIDLILTDPPYFKVKNLPWDRQWDTAAGYLEWLDRVLVEFYRVLKPNGSLYLFASPKMAARVEVLTSGRFNVLNRITWAKHDGTYNQGGLWSRADKNTLRRFFEQKEEIIFAEHHGADGYAKGPIGEHYFQPIQNRLTEAKTEAVLRTWPLYLVCRYHKLRTIFDAIVTDGGYLPKLP